MFDCPNCKNRSRWHLLRVEKRGHVYFVRFTYGKDYWMACEVCKVGFELNEEESKEAEAVIQKLEDVSSGKATKDEALSLISESKLVDLNRRLELKRQA